MEYSLGHVSSSVQIILCETAIDFIIKSMERALIITHVTLHLWDRDSVDNVKKR